MEKFSYEVPVEATGRQMYCVSADTESEARAILEAGDGEFQEEELEVQVCRFAEAELVEVDDGRPG